MLTMRKVFPNSVIIWVLSHVRRFVTSNKGGRWLGWFPRRWCTFFYFLTIFISVRQFSPSLTAVFFSLKNLNFLSKPLFYRYLVFNNIGLYLPRKGFIFYFSPKTWKKSKFSVFDHVKSKICNNGPKRKNMLDR